MDQEQSNIPTTSAQDAPVVSPSSPNLTEATPATPESNPPANFNPSRKKLFLVVLAVIIVAVVLGGGYFLWQRSQNKTPQPTPTPTQEASANPDPTADWKTYTNTIQKYSIKYPSDWKINSSQADVLQNSILELTKDQAKIAIYANLIGIGGLGQNYEGTPVKVGGVDLYEYNVPALDDKTQRGGVTDSLTESLGVFQANGKTYSITITYPISYNETEKGSNLKKEFDQFLSTFKFIEEASETPSFSTPTANSTVSSPLVVKGVVPAGWMFEGQLPIKLLDSDRNEIATGTGKETKPGSWQSGKPVDFKGTLTFTTTAKSGYLVVSKDNPSGLPENDESYEISVKF